MILPQAGRFELLRTTREQRKGLIVFRLDWVTMSLFRFPLLLVSLVLVAGILSGGHSRAQIQFGKPKPEKPLPNPFIIGASRDEAMKAAKQMLETREIPLDKEECNQQNGECTLITKQMVFIRGITTKSQLQHYCDIGSSDVRDWSKGRYVLRIQISPATPSTSQVGISARFDGMTAGVVSNEWVPLTSRGELEDKLLRCLDQRVKGVECKDEEK